MLLNRVGRAVESTDVPSLGWPGKGMEPKMEDKLTLRADCARPTYNDEIEGIPVTVVSVNAAGGSVYGIRVPHNLRVDDMHRFQRGLSGEVIGYTQRTENGWLVEGHIVGGSMKETVNHVLLRYLARGWRKQKGATA